MDAGLETPTFLLRCEEVKPFAIFIASSHLTLDREASEDAR